MLQQVQVRFCVDHRNGFSRIPRCRLTLPRPIMRRMWTVTTAGDIPDEHEQRRRDASESAWDDYTRRILEFEVHGFRRAREVATGYGLRVCELVRGIRSGSRASERPKVVALVGRRYAVETHPTMTNLISVVARRVAAALNSAKLGPESGRRPDRRNPAGSSATPRPDARQPWASGGHNRVRRTPSRSTATPRWVMRPRLAPYTSREP